MTEPNRKQHQALQARAERVIPNGVYGHGALIPPAHPRFYSRGEGCRVWDVDGNEYVDFMCGYGPNLLGMCEPRVEAAAERQRKLGDSFNGPTERMVELAEVLTGRIRHAEWGLFCKNGTDATTLASTVARAATGRRKLLVAGGAYHGAAPWCTPSDGGVLEEDRAHLLTYDYNDLQSVDRALAQAGDDFAGIVVSPFRHDAFHDQELVTPEFARGLRERCDAGDAALILDEVRAGFRLVKAGSWEHLGVDADLSAWGKAMGNGYAISVTLGSEAYRDAVAQVYATGSFWYASVPMAAALETIRIVDGDDVVAGLVAQGQRLRDGWNAQAKAHGFSIRQTGPVQMPLVMFDDDDDLAKVTMWASEAVRRGVYVHPWHNMFLCAAHKEADIDFALERTNDAFAAVAKALGG
jgi:glutamate-1-semialdehyde 2,1-aminomutase